MDLLLFLKSAKCLINAEQFLVVFQIHFLNNLYLSDQGLTYRYYSTSPGADLAFLIKEEPNFDIFLSDLSELFQRVQFSIVSRSS